MEKRRRDRDRREKDERVKDVFTMLWSIFHRRYTAFRDTFQLYKPGIYVCESDNSRVA